MICANAPLTIKAVKFTVGEILKDESKRNVARVDEMVEAVLRQPRLHRRPHRLHGEAQAGIYRDVDADFATLPTPAHSSRDWATR